MSGWTVQPAGKGRLGAAALACTLMTCGSQQAARFAGGGPTAPAPWPAPGAVRDAATSPTRVVEPAPERFVGLEPVTPLGRPLVGAALHGGRWILAGEGWGDELLYLSGASLRSRVRLEVGGYSDAGDAPRFRVPITRLRGLVEVRCEQGVAHCLLGIVALDERRPAMADAGPRPAFPLVRIALQDQSNSTNPGILSSLVTWIDLPDLALVTERAQATAADAVGAYDVGGLALLPDGACAASDGSAADRVLYVETGPQGARAVIRPAARAARSVMIPLPGAPDGGRARAASAECDGDALRLVVAFSTPGGETAVHAWSIANNVATLRRDAPATRAPSNARALAFEGDCLWAATFEVRDVPREITCPIGVPCLGPPDAGVGAAHAGWVRLDASVDVTGAADALPLARGSQATLLRACPAAR